MFTSTEIDRFLAALGEILGSSSLSVQILIVGGASLSLAGWIPPRSTRDVDVLAAIEGDAAGPVLVPAAQLPPAFFDAVARVARDFNLPSDWLNVEIAAQWKTGLPPSASNDMEWRDYGALKVALAGRSTMIALKLFATVDRGPESVHFQDLVALDPTADELVAAASWVRSQDVAPEFASILEQAIAEVRSHVERDSRNRD
jgi:hypothetical protein